MPIPVAEPAQERAALQNASSAVQSVVDGWCTYSAPRDGFVQVQEHAGHGRSRPPARPGRCRAAAVRQPVAEQGAGRGRVVPGIGRDAWPRGPAGPRPPAGAGGRDKARRNATFEPGARVRARLADDPRREGPGGLDVGRVVQEDEGLERRVRPRPLDDALLARRGIEGQQAGCRKVRCQ